MTDDLRDLLERVLALRETVYASVSPRSLTDAVEVFDDVLAYLRESPR